MLVLTRKLGESLMIADSITVTVLQIKGGNVRIGVQAPPHMTIVREEVQADSSQWHSAASKIEQQR